MTRSGTFSVRSLPCMAVLVALFALFTAPDRLGAQAAKPPAKAAAKSVAAGPQRVASTDPALRLKGFDANQAMNQASPFKDLAWQFLGPTNVSGRSLGIAVVGPRGKHYTIFAATHGRGTWVPDVEPFNRKSTRLRRPFEN